MTKDYNGIRIKPGHNGTKALPFGGDDVWLLKRNDDKLYGYWNSRHDAVAARTTKFRNTVKREWLEPIMVPTGTVRMSDVVVITE